MSELLFEIGSEEMPARFVRPALEDLREKAIVNLPFANRPDNEVGLTEAIAGDIEVWGTPRRLTLVARNLREKEPDTYTTVYGPPLKAAYDATGQPTKAALGFARSQGVEVSQLKTLESDKGPRLAFTSHNPGRPIIEALSQLLPYFVTSLNFPKTMRWGAEKIRYARPIHWLLALLDGAVVPFELAGIKSGNLTYGHRFHAPGAIMVSGAADYLAKLREAKVLVVRDERRQATAAEVAAAAAAAGGRLVPDEALLEEVTDLVEQPVACAGAFDREFLAVPRPVIISAMRGHQRYFALEDAAGELLPAFVAVNNTRPKNLAVVSSGHERVLRARLADASLFVREDTKRPLISRLEDLKQVTYHAKLGTSFDKVERFTKLAVWLAERLAPAEVAKVERAARLAKCDLVTGMVGEFPELQGQVGADYARRDGEDPEVAAAIAEHYLPAGEQTEIPAGITGCLVGLADRLDTLCGLFGVGETPTGAADPYALRRATFAIIRLIVENKWRLSLSGLIDQTLAGLGDSARNTASRDLVLNFTSQRMYSYLQGFEVPTDVIRAVLAAGFDDLTATKAKALALAEMKQSADFAALAAGLKRVVNILRKESEQVPETPPDPALFNLDAERDLWSAFSALRAEAAARFAAGEYLAFLQGLSALKAPIDKFFDDVMVMVEDEAVRRNRLALLNQIASEFGKLAEFGTLQLG